MKKRLLPLLTLLGITATADAQQATLQRAVVASAGGTAQLNQIIFQYTIGEVLTTTIALAPLMLSQGFQQPEIAGGTVIPEAPLVYDFMVYPNPAKGQTKLVFDLVQDQLVHVQLVNNAGQTIRTIPLKLLAGKIAYTLPLYGYSSGLYYVTLQAGNKRYSEKLVIQ
jgi:hypothetical protein